jgi:hypothetical protein
MAEQILAQKDSPSRKAIEEAMKPYDKFVTGSVNPLWAGRLQQFAGRYTTQVEGTPRRDHDAPIGEKGAKPLLLESRAMLQKLSKEDLPEEIRERMVEIYKRGDLIRRDGTWNLAMIAMDEQNYDLADYYLGETRKLENSENWPSDARKRGTRMALARSREAAGRGDEAISNYLAVSGPEANEAYLRAARLAAAAGRPLSSYQPASDSPPADSDSPPAEIRKAAGSGQ